MLEQPDHGPMPAEGGGLGGVIVNVFLSLAMVVILWIPTACLYPLTAAAGIVTALVTRSLASRVLPPDAGDVPLVLGFAVGAVAIGIAIRLEGRLAGSAGYRLVRHVVRLILLALVAIPIIQLTMGATAPSTTTRYIFAVVTSLYAIAQFLTHPLNLGVWLAVLVGLHFLIWHGEPVRRFWHRRLAWIGLK